MKGDNLKIYNFIFMSVQEILSLLAKNIKHNKIPQRTIEKVKFSNRGYSLQYVTERDYFFVVKKLKYKIYDGCEMSNKNYLPQTKKCLELLLKEGILNATTYSETKGNSIKKPFKKDFLFSLADKSIFFIINHYLKRANCFEMKSAILNTIIKQFLKEKQKRQNGYQVFVPIIGLNINATKIKLDKNFSIKELTLREKELIHDTLNNAESHKPDLINEIKYKLCYLKYFERNDLYDSKYKNIARENIQNAIISLRLLGKGQFLALTKYHTELPVKNKDAKFSSTTYGYGSLENFGELGMRIPEFNLSINLHKKLYEIYNKISKPDINNELKQLNIGLRKFNQSFIRKTDEDKILDYAICLESTLMSDIVSANYHKLSTRGAYILKKHVLQYNKFHFISSMFELRNDIVHKGWFLINASQEKKHRKSGEILVDKKLYSFNKLMSIFEDIVRLVLLEYLERIKPNIFINTINKGIDEEIAKYLNN